MQQLDAIRIDSLPVDCIVGILPEERTTPQPVVITVELKLDLTTPAESGNVAETVDYAAAAREVAFIMTAGRFPLLETAALALCRYLAKPPVEQAQVTITKPRALNRVGVPSVTLERSPRYDFTGRGPIFGGADAGVYVLGSTTDKVEPPFSWSAHEDLPLPDGGILRVYRR